MFGPWIETWIWVQANLVPRRLKLRRPSFNFITLHYLYMISMTLIGSILLFPPGGLSYIDSLLFSSGSVTQSGLNPVDVNKLYLYQQLVIFFIACVCNPIIINTFVVFVRLYWFEKRFQNVVQEARNLRRERTRSRTKSESKEDHNIDGEERGVGNRKIVVLRGTTGPAHGTDIDDGDRKLSSLLVNDGEGSSSEHVAGQASQQSNGSLSPPAREDFTPFHRDIVFADEVDKPRRISNSDRMPERRPTEQHIAFVENQRNPKDKATLRIPGPRDFDRGDLPQRVENGEEANGGGHLTRQMTGEGDAMPPSSAYRQEELNGDDHPTKHPKDEASDERPMSRFRTGLSAVKSPFHFSRSLKATGSHGIMHLRNRTRSRTFGSFTTSRSQDKDPMPYLSWTPTIGRNSAFVDLTEEQREELGGIEYRALKTLAFILVFYFIGFHLMGVICLVPWILRTSYGSILPPVSVNKVWWGFFTPASMFNDLGFTLTPDSMISFQTAVLPMLLGSFLIIAGNTGFPCMLRLIIWISSKCVPHGSSVWEELQFLLDHPRRCFTLLFPSDATWWLFWVLVLLNGVDLIFFIILDLNDNTVTALHPGYRVLDGLFQAASTRTAGFSCVNLAKLHPAIQVSYLIMMYISVFPIAISMRRTNVYEEKSLGVYADNNEDDEGKQHSYVGTHLRRQLSFDLWYVFLGFFFIAIVEGSRLENTNDYAFTLFSVLFEIVSAYGTVGMSLGYPGINASFCAEFRVLSKLVIIAMQLRGRHRGLPYALDRAILLPSESLHKKEDADATLRARRNSNISEMAVAEGLIGRRGSMSGASGAGLGARPPLERYRRGSHASTIKDGERDKREGGGLARLLSGALSAGPTIPRERKDKDNEKKA